MAIARTNPDRARESVRSILEQIQVRPDNGVLDTEIGLNENPSLLSQEGCLWKW